MSVLAFASLALAPPAFASLALAPPAHAAPRIDDGAEPGEPLSLLATVLIFGVLPLALFVVIALLVMLPSMAKGPRYRPGVGWWASPVWFNGPSDPETTAAAAIAERAPTTGGGGTRARW
jgi:hypothetical protein